jgi:hypothetical protein
LRNNGTTWEASGALINDGTNIGVGRTPSYILDVNGPIRIQEMTVSQGNNAIEGCIAIGTNSLANNSSGYENIAIGGATLISNTSGVANIALGIGSLVGLSSGNSNIGIGMSSSQYLANQSGNIAIGGSTLNQSTSSFGDDNIAIGTEAGGAIAGSNSIAIGRDALLSPNPFVASIAFDNVAIGAGSQAINTLSSFNTTIGNYTARSGPGSNITAIGYASQEFANGSANTSVGTSSLRNSTASYNCAFGFESMLNTTGGVNNAAYGFQSMRQNTSGLQNTASGMYSFYENTTGSYNTCIGNNTQVPNAVNDHQIVIGTSSDTTYISGGLNITSFTSPTLFTNAIPQCSTSSTVNPLEMANVQTVQIFILDNFQTFKLFKL